MLPNGHVVSYPHQQGLLDALCERRLLVVVGPAVREAAGLLGMREIVDVALSEPEFGETEQADIRALAVAGRFADAFEAIKYRLGPRFASVFEPLLAGPKVAPPASLRALAGLAEQLSMILTTNLDSLVETTLSGAWVALAGATADLATRTRTVFKLLGTAHVVSSWKFTADGLQNATYRLAHVRQEVSAVLRTHQLLLVGFRGDDELLEQIVRMREHAPEDRNAPEWVALVPPGTSDIARQAFGRRGVALVTIDIPMGDTAAYDAAVAAHLRSLAQAFPPTSPPISAPEPTLTGNPYPGLAPFIEAQAAQFFGRTDARVQLLGKLGRRGPTHVRWLALTGPSGVGKSSLLAAGLVPALRAGESPVPDAPTRWAVAQLRPGREILRNLAEAVRTALRRDLGVTAAPELLTRDILLHDRLLVDFLGPRLEGAGLLVVIDQFEETFTVGAAEDRPYLDALLVRSLQDVDVPFYLVTALRSDCAGELARHFPRLAEQQNLGTLSARHDLVPLRPHELREAIERPAELAGRVFEPGLVERILYDAGSIHTDTSDVTPDAALPLVAHVLYALHEQAAGRALTLRAYEALGGVSESLTRSADGLLTALAEEFSTEQVRNLLVALVELHPQGRDTRRVLPWSAALAAAGGADDSDETARERAQALLRRLSGSTAGLSHEPSPVRLLATCGNGELAVVDLVHDALLREWSTLRGWLQEDRAIGLLSQELERAAEGWATRGQSDDELWRGGRLVRADALNRRLLPPVVRSFLAAAAKLASDEAAAQAAEQIEKLQAAEALAAAERARAEDARRKNHWLLGLGGVLIVATAFAATQYQHAITASKLAENRLTAANIVVEQILHDVLPKLEAIAGTADVRKQIHGSLETLQQTLLPGAGDDARVQRNRMAQHLDRGMVAFTHDDLTLARQEFKEALIIAEILLKRDPQNVDSQRSLSAALERLGAVEENAGNLAAARVNYKRSLVLAEEEAKTAPESTAAQHNLSAALSKLGDVELEGGNLLEARARYERALAVTEALAKETLYCSESLRPLAICLDRLGDVESRSGNLERARSNYERSLAIRETLAKAAPQSTQAQHDLQASLSKLGEVEMSAGNLAKGRAQHERSLAIAEALAKADPQSIEFQRSLSISHEHLGRIEVQAENFAVARVRYEHSLALREALAKVDPQSAQAQRDLTFALDNLGDMEIQAGNLAQARAYYERVLSVRETLAKADPQSAQAQRDVSIAINQLGNLEVQAKNFAGARAQYERSLVVAEELAKADPQSARAQRDISVILDLLGDMDLLMGNLPRARAQYERSLVIAEAQAKADPHNADCSYDLFVSYMKFYFLAAAERNLAEMSERLALAEAILDTMETRGQIEGYAERERARTFVNDRLTHHNKTCLPHTSTLSSGANVSAACDGTGN